MDHSLERRSILVVENEALSAFDIVHVFESAGARVVMSNSVELALQLIEAEGWSAVVTSALTETNCSRLRERLKRRDIPLVRYTGSSLVGGTYLEDAWAYQSAGFTMLVKAVEELVQDRSLSR